MLINNVLNIIIYITNENKKSVAKFLSYTDNLFCKVHDFKLNSDKGIK